MVPDTHKDTRFFDNPLVTNGPKIRFYAGVPISAESGHKIGTVCIIDRLPRQLNDHDVEHLKLLATVVAQELEATPEHDGQADWTHEMSVGCASLDDDHKALFSIACLLRDMANNGSGDLDISSCLNLLQEYATGHFAREEAAMMSAGYPDLLGHKAFHDYYTRAVREFIVKYRDDDIAAALVLARLTTNWWANHIRKIDAKYKDWLTEKDVDNRPLAFLAYEKEKVSGDIIRFPTDGIWNDFNG